MLRGKTQHHEEENRVLSREVIVLNNHLMETKITLDKLRKDNVSHSHTNHYKVTNYTKCDEPFQAVLMST